MRAVLVVACVLLSACVARSSQVTLPVECRYARWTPEASGACIDAIDRYLDFIGEHLDEQ